MSTDIMGPDATAGAGEAESALAAAAKPIASRRPAGRAMPRTLRIGTRESLLAVRQAELVMAAIRADHPGIGLELVRIRTAGDRNLDANLSALGGKGLFVKELEQALAEGQVDIAVHSYKDMPYEEDPRLPVVALSRREAPYDALVLPEGATEMDPSLPLGSASRRRSVQLARLYPQMEVAPIRGNVLTRLAKLDLGEYAGIVLAEAGLIRLGLAGRISRRFGAEEMVPAGSQGIIAVQARAGDNCAYLSGLHSWESEVVSRAERQYLRSLGSDCAAPVAVFGQLVGDRLSLSAMYVDEAGRTLYGSLEGDASQAAALGQELAERLMRGEG